MLQTAITGIVNLVCNAGAGQVIKNTIQQLTPDNLKKSEKILTVIGGVAISAVASKAIGDYVEKEVDSIFEFGKKYFDKKEEVIIEAEIIEEN